MIQNHEIPGALVIIIVLLIILCSLIFLAFLGYLPSPLSNQLDAHDKNVRRSEKQIGLQCGVLMEMRGRDPLLCFDEKVVPERVFIGTR